MDNGPQCRTTHKPPHTTHHTETHEPRARGALAMAMAHGVPYISSASGSNMAALLHCCTPGSPTGKGGSEQWEVVIRGARGACPVSMAQHVSCRTVAENKNPPTHLPSPSHSHQFLATGTSSALLLFSPRSPLLSPCCLLQSSLLSCPTTQPKPKPSPAQPSPRPRPSSSCS